MSVSEHGKRRLVTTAAREEQKGERVDGAGGFHLSVSLRSDARGLVCRQSAASLSSPFFLSKSPPLSSTAIHFPPQNQNYYSILFFEFELVKRNKNQECNLMPTRTCPNWGDLPKCRAGVCDCAALRNARAVRAKVGFFRKRFGSASASRVSFFARCAAAAPFWGGRSRKMAEAGPSRVPDRPRRVVQTKSEGDVIPQSRH